MDKYKVDVPEGQSGVWKVERYTVTPEAERFESLRTIVTGRGRFVPAGKYTGLFHRGIIVMTDTPDEIRDHFEAIYQAKGNVLVNGLGLGVIIQAMLEKPEVERVTVIEISPDVIALVGPHYQTRYDGRLEIIQADALTWKPPKGKRYNAVWHDIWNNLCSDNLPEMHTLHRRYGRRADWQDSWGRDLCERYRASGY